MYTVLVYVLYVKLCFKLLEKKSLQSDRATTIIISYVTHLIKLNVCIS